MLKKIFVICAFIMIITISGCSVAEKTNSESLPEIVRVEGHEYNADDAAKDKDIVIEQTETISYLLEILENMEELENYSISSHTEEISLDFYKPSVAMVKSDDIKVYTVILYKDSNIVKMEIELDLDGFTTQLIGDTLSIYYEMSDEDKKFIESLF